MAQLAYRYNGIAGQGGHSATTKGLVSTELLLQTYPGCTVTVYQAGTLNLASIYGDSVLTPKGNPFTASLTDASYFFYAANGNYDIKFSGTGITTPFTLGDVIINGLLGNVVDSSSYATLLAAVTAIGSTPTTLTVTTAAWPNGGNCTVPATLQLDFLGGGSLTVATGQTVTILSDAERWPIRTIFNNSVAGQGTINFAGNYSLQSVHPEWFGASPSASAATNTPALQAAIIGAFGNNRTNASGLWVYNRELHFSGNYQINNELQCYHMIGFKWAGENKFNSGITQTATNKRIIDGQSVSYGVFDQLTFSTTASQNVPLVDLDYSGAQGSDLRPQNITFNDCVITGNAAGYVGVQIAKSGGGAQGDNVRFSNCYGSGFSEAAFQIGTSLAYAYNGIWMQFIGGDIQGCPKYGIAAYGGSYQTKNVTMENSSQTGSDFFATASQNVNLIEGTRSESLMLTSGTGPFEIKDCTQVIQASLWFDLNGGLTPGLGLGGTTLGVGQLITGTYVGGDGKYYKVTIGGVAGGLPLTQATGGTLTTVVKAAAGWTVNAFVGYRVSIISGLGKKQYGIVTANDATTITVGAGWVTDYDLRQMYPSFAIVAPDATSLFTVEPNWGTQTVTGGVTFALFDFYSLGGPSNYTLKNVTLQGGKILGTPSPPTAYATGLWGGGWNNLSVSRSDAFVDTGNFLDTTISTAHISDVYILRPNGTYEYLIPFHFKRNAVAEFTDAASQDQHGSQWVVWSRGQFGGGAGYPELGIGPGDNESQTTTDNDVLAYLGKLGRRTPQGVNGAGVDTDIQGGKPTGSGTPGDIKFWVPAAIGSSGNTVRAGQVVAGVSGRNGVSWTFKGADVVAAAAIVPTGNLFHVTGNTNITSITSTGIVAGTRITIIFDGTPTFTDGSNLKLAGNFVATADDTITLVYDGSNWYEICRSIN